MTVLNGIGRAALRRHASAGRQRLGRRLTSWMWGSAALVLMTGLDCCDNSLRKSPTGVDSAGLQTVPTAEASAVGPAGTTPGDDPDESAADLSEHHVHHHHGGFAMFIAMSADLLGTTPEQATAITKIQRDLRSEMQPARDAEKDLLLMLASGIAAGNIDKGRVDTATAKLSAAATGVHDLAAESLNRLHGVLTPAQRVALVDKLEAHFQVWNDVNSPDASAEDRGHGAHLRELTKKLALTPEQVDRVRVSLKAAKVGTPVPFDRADAEAHLRAFSVAFEGDAFDAKAFPNGGPVNAHIAAWGAARAGLFYEAIAPVLTPDQRTKLSESLRRHANYTQPPLGT